MHGSCAIGHTDFSGGDGLVWLEVLIEMNRQGGGEALAPVEGSDENEVGAIECDLLLISDMMYSQGLRTTAHILLRELDEAIHDQHLHSLAIRRVSSNHPDIRY